MIDIFGNFCKKILHVLCKIVEKLEFSIKCLDGLLVDSCMGDQRTRKTIEYSFTVEQFQRFDRKPDDLGKL